MRHDECLTSISLGSREPPRRSEPEVLTNNSVARFWFAAGHERPTATSKATRRNTSSVRAMHSDAAMSAAGVILPTSEPKQSTHAGVGAVDLYWIPLGAGAHAART